MQTPYEQAIQSQRIREQLEIAAGRCRRRPRSELPKETLTEMYNKVRLETAAELARSELALVEMVRGREREREREETRRMESHTAGERDNARKAGMDVRTPDANRMRLSQAALVRLQKRADLQASGEILRGAIAMDAENARKRIEEREREAKKKVDLKVNVDLRTPDAGGMRLSREALVQLQEQIDLQTSGDLLRRAIEVDAEKARQRIAEREREGKKKADLKRRGEVLRNMIEGDAEKARRALMNREREKENAKKREMETGPSVSTSGPIGTHPAKADLVQIHLELGNMQIASDTNGNGSSPVKRRVANQSSRCANGKADMARPEKSSDVGRGKKVDAAA
jgi:hypothetical protein